MSNNDLSQAIEYLNSINIDEFLEPGRSVEDIMNEIDAIYGGEYENQTGDYLFGGWTEDDFANYIRQEYGLKCYERSVLFVK